MYKRVALNGKHRFVVKCSSQAEFVFQTFRRSMFFFDPLTLPVAGFPGRTSNILWPDIQADFRMQLDRSKSINQIIRSSIFATQKTSSFGRLRLSHLRSPCLEDPSILSRQMSLDCVDCGSHIEAVWRVMKKHNRQSFHSHAFDSVLRRNCQAMNTWTVSKSINNLQFALSNYFLLHNLGQFALFRGLHILDSSSERNRRMRNTCIEDWQKIIHVASGWVCQESQRFWKKWMTWCRTSPHRCQHLRVGEVGDVGEASCFILFPSFSMQTMHLLSQRWS